MNYQIDVNATAFVLGITPAGVRRLVARGILRPAGRGKRGMLLFEAADIQARIGRRVAPVRKSQQSVTVSRSRTTVS